MKKWKSCLLLAISAALLSFGISNCSTTKRGTNTAGNKKQEANHNGRKLLLRDEGLSQLAYIDLADSTKNWYVPVPAGRDMQLIGNSRVLIGTGTGYEERDIRTGNKLFELTSFSGTVAARRLRNGNTLLTGLNWKDKKGVVLLELDQKGNTQRLMNYPDFTYVRLVRETATGTFLIAADDTIIEGNAAGHIIWQAKLTGRNKMHAWQALRLANGQTIVSSGYGANFQLFAADGSFVSAIMGPPEVNPHFYAGFQIVENGNYVVTNWQGHGPHFGASGTQLLEYNPAGELVWSWKQFPNKFSSLQGVIVLDGLDINKLHIEDRSGILKPVQ